MKKRGSHTKLTGKLSRAGAMNERMDTVVFHLQIKAEEEAPNPRFLTREDTTSINHKVLRVLSVQWRIASPLSYQRRQRTEQDGGVWKS